MSELLDIWEVWLSGSKTDSLSLWGFPLLFWGRIGRIAEFVAALVVIAEFLGPRTLRKYGESLRRLSPGRTPRILVVASLSWLYQSIAHIFAPTGSKEEGEALERAVERDELFYLNILMSLIMAGYIAYELQLPWFVETLISLVAFAFLLVTVSPVITAGSAALLPGLRILIDAILIRPILGLLELEQPAQIKIGSLLLLAAGFHFDLLAS